MKRLLLLAIATTASILAQPATLTLTGPVTARPGANVNLVLTATGPSNTGATGIQWRIGYPASYTGTVTAGPTAANKTLSCTTDQAFCLVAGTNNAAVIPNGVLANYSVRIPATATPGSTTISLSGLLAGSADGFVAPTALGVPYSINILARQDINGDGTVNATDVSAMMAQVVASESTPAVPCAADPNGDGQCNVLDVVAVLLKSLGLVP